MSAHTPGPWRVASRGSFFSQRGAGVIATTSEGDFVIYGPLDSVQDSDESSDASLIAAAPELFAILQEIASTVDESAYGPGDLPDRIQEALANAKRAPR